MDYFLAFFNGGGVTRRKRVGSRFNNMYNIEDMRYTDDIWLISEEEEKERWKVRGMEKPDWS